MMGGGGGLGSTIMTGMAFGAGSAVAHEAVRGMMGSGGGHGAQGQGYAEPQQQQPAMAAEQYGQPGAVAQQQQQVQQNPCMSFNQYLLSCLKDNTNNIGICQSNMDMLAQCEKDNAAYYRGF